MTAPHLVAVPPAPPDDDAPDPTFSEITDTHLAFTGAINTLAIDAKSGALKLTFLIDTDNEITHRDFLPLRYRFLEVQVSARSKSGEVTNPKVDPVAAAVRARRVERMVDGWLEGPDDAAVLPD